jgi:hypothetical protein
MQTFITANPPSGRFGFIVLNARCAYDDVRIWRMNTGG